MGALHLVPSVAPAVTSSARTPPVRAPRLPTAVRPEVRAAALARAYAELFAARDLAAPFGGAR
jgi:hypothetical protein